MPEMHLDLASSHQNQEVDSGTLSYREGGRSFPSLIAQPHSILQRFIYPSTLHVAGRIWALFSLTRHDGVSGCTHLPDAE